MITTVRVRLVVAVGIPVACVAGACFPGARHAPERSAAAMRTYPGYPHRLDRADPRMLAERRAEADSARTEGWEVQFDEDGFVELVTKQGAQFGDHTNQLGPLDDTALARLREWILAHPAMFGIDRAGERDFETRRLAPYGPSGALCQRSGSRGGRRAACIYIAWTPPLYANQAHETRELIILSGHHWPDLPPLPPALDDAIIANLAIEASPPWSPWKFYGPITAKNFRQISGRSEMHDDAGEHYREIDIHRSMRRVRSGNDWYLRMVAMVTQLPTPSVPERHVWYFDEVTGEKLQPGDIR